MIGRAEPSSGRGPYGVWTDTSVMARKPIHPRVPTVTGATALYVAQCVTPSYIICMSLTRSLKNPGFKPGGRFGLASTESRDPIGFAVAALNRVAQSDLID